MRDSIERFTCRVVPAGLESIHPRRERRNLFRPILAWRVAPVYLFFIEPPDPNYHFVPSGSHMKVDGDSVKVGQNAEVDRLLSTLPQNATTYRFFLEKWNAFLYLAGGSVEFSWDDGKAF